ncbi:hypothetical protein [Maribacter sp. 2304DJ31-5]|uniref:hypothetical protein n=1 Tax=Maribacter sp. 2304DJ31-5 TaxID=3386273 RepID=UPI0039BD25B1
MKNYPTLKKMLIGSMLSAFTFFISCSKDETTNETEESTALTAAELKFSDETELISEDILGLVEDVYTTDEISSTSKSNYGSDYLPDCVTITTVVTDTTKEKTIDFGEGCELPNGNVLSGIIYLSYERQMEVAQKNLSLSLENFAFNGVSVEGTASVERIRSNENNNPQSDAIWSFTASWPDGETVSFNGDRTREWVEGFGSGFWGDNAFLITGKGTYTGKLGNTIQKEVLEPLRREWSCRFIVSGILSITKSDARASLDFGDGSCDAKGILTYPNGESQEIFLRRFSK